jgi:hypothetical protein
LDHLSAKLDLPQFIKVIMRAAITLIFLMLAVSFASAEPATFDFGGERFVKKFDASKAPNAQVEFGLPAESIEAWTRLVTVHAFPNGGNDAMRAAANLANLIRQRYPAAKYKVINNPKTFETIIDFLLPVPKSEMIEFNVFKYAPAGDGLVALQFARRVKLGDVGADELSGIRQRAIKEMAAYEMGPVKAYFGK